MFAVLFYICFIRVLADNTTMAITLRTTAAANESMREQIDKLDIEAVPSFGSFHFFVDKDHIDMSCTAYAYSVHCLDII